MARELEATPQEVLAEEEPRYLRRQKPLEIRRRKFGRKTWPFYRRAAVAGAGAVAGAWLLYAAGSFFLYSPRVRLADADQIDVGGNRYVAREAVVERFSSDVGKSVLRVPLDDRRKQIEAIPWVSRAVVSRIWPDQIRVEIAERAPIAYLRNGTDLALIDAHGVILDRPVEANFQFPVVSGIVDAMPLSQREPRMALYSELLRGLDQVRPGASDHVSEVDVSDAEDIRATLAGINQMGIAGVDDQGPVLVHFGNKDFDSKFRVFVENIAQWRATVGRVESVDLRFSRQVVVNPETNVSASNAALRRR
jgi:cell division protein FtsQ